MSVVGRRVLPIALVAVIALAGLVAAALAMRLPSATRIPLDLGSLATYPPAGGTAAGEPVTMTGAGDIASCDRDEDEATGALLEDVPGWVFTAGDNAYEHGTTTEFEECYDASWGAYRDRTFPALGNHDVEIARAAGYFAYFGGRAGDRRAGWYALDLGSWRLIVLNSNCGEAGGCDAASDQGRWLAAELAAHPTACTLAIWHHPRWSTGHHGPTSSVAPFWDALHAAGAELIVNGHDHDYERFVLLDASGTPDEARGIRQIVAGTGGAALRPFEEQDPHSEVRDASTYGVLRLDLRPGSYDWEFIPAEGGSFTDTGSGSCH